MPYETCVLICISSSTQYMHCFAQRRPQALTINNSNDGAHSLVNRREASRNPTIDTACVMKLLPYRPRFYFHMISRNAKIQRSLPLHTTWP